MIFLECDARGFGPVDVIDVVYNIKFVVRALGHTDSIKWILIRHNDERVGFKKFPPHFHEIQVLDQGCHNNSFIEVEKERMEKMDACNDYRLITRHDYIACNRTHQ